MFKFKRQFLKKFLTSCTVLILALSLSGIPSFAADRVFFYHTDPAGTPVAMTDDNGTVVWEADYMPFGEEHSLIESVKNKNRFVGKEKDEETDLYYFGARYLDARIGRFVKTDPVGIRESDLMAPQRFNRYSYSLNNPYRYVDPDGSTVWDIADIGFFGYSLYRFAKDPSWSNAGDLGLDTLGLLPLVPSIGSIKVVGKAVNKFNDAIDASNIVKKGSKFKWDQKIQRWINADTGKSLEDNVMARTFGDPSKWKEGTKNVSEEMLRLKENTEFYEKYKSSREADNLGSAIEAVMKQKKK